jgi:hypothetical protein
VALAPAFTALFLAATGAAFAADFAGLATDLAVAFGDGLAAVFDAVFFETGFAGGDFFLVLAID